MEQVHISENKVSADKQAVGDGLTNDLLLL